MTSLLLFLASSSGHDLVRIGAVTIALALIASVALPAFCQSASKRHQ